MPSTTPILTLNTEMHTAMIRHISTDRRGRYLLACSRDKTAKLWELASGELLRTFRPPVGEAQEGMLYACALSPDGQTVAVGGWSAKNDIYIFDATSGLLQHRITGLPNVIFSLEYSPDGRFLAAALGGKNGIRIYNSHDYTQQAGDTDYGADSYNLAFDAWGRLATVCWDGHVRLYDNDFKLIKKAATKAGKMPFSIAFSPDTHLLAVGFEDSPIIQVLDAKTMGVLYEPDIEGVNDNGGMDILSFSADGARLAAGGAYQQNKEGKWWRQIRIWEKAGKGSWTDYNAGGNTIMDIKPLPHGGFVFGGAKPDWGIIDPDEGRRSLYRKGEVNEYRSKDRSHFRLGPGGTEVGVTPSNQSPLMFSIQGRQLSKTASRHPAASSEQGSLKVEDWKNQYSPKLNGKPLSFLDEYERCRSVDIATGGQGIAVGTEWKVRCTDAGGRLRWTQPVQGGAFCVKIDAYNEVVAAALDDGTIRWFRFLDGQPLLSLYLHPDDERWVLWTPSGYYDAAPGAENLIGWHVNNGEDKEASYYPISKFRQTYHRPDVIDLILETLDEEKALERANRESNRRRTAPTPITAQLPPTVRILSPTEEAELSSTTVTLAYTVESPNDEPVTGVRIQVDGRPVATERGFDLGAKRHEVAVTIPASDCVVSVIAENRFGASEPAAIRLRWRGAPPPPTVDDIRPSLYVLAVGVSQYEHPQVRNLSYAAKDATDFLAAIQQQEGRLYKKVKAQLLTEAQATKDNILDGLDWLQRETTSRDVAMLFFAGHGLDDNSGNFFYLPANANPDAMRRTCLLHAEVQTTVASVAGKIVVFMDACHSGSLMREIRRRNLPPDIAVVINELISAENGAVVFSSATTRQYALEDPKWSNGAFTEALLEGLSGRAKAPDSNKVTVKTLDAYVCERVKQLTGGKQSPATAYPPNVPDFPVGVVNV